MTKADIEEKKSIADFALKELQKVADYAEVRLESTTSNGFVMKNGTLQVSEFSDYSGIGMRFLCDKSLGFASTNVVDKQTLIKTIRRAISQTRSASRIKEAIGLASEKPHKDTYEVMQKLNVLDVSTEEKIKLLKDTDRSILDTGIDVPGRYIALSDHITTEYLLTSEGTAITATVPKVNMMYYLTVKQDSKTSQRYWTYGNSGGFEFVNSWKMPELLSGEVSMMSKMLKSGKKYQPKTTDIVVAPQVVGIMVHESVGHPYEADRILGREAAQAGESFVTKDMLGSMISNECVTVVDDPTVENSYGFFKYDNEGVKARRKFLIKEGKITEFLHNRATAYQMGISSNGSSRAVDFDRESIVRMSNTLLVPGEYTEEELIEDIKDGVYIKNFMEWNIDDKRLHQKYVGAEAYAIRDGELKEPVFNPTIEISTPELWKKVDAVANNTEYHAGNCGKGEPMQGIPVWFGGPSMRLRNIRLK